MASLGNPKAALNSTLVDCRFFRIHGEVGNRPDELPSGGILNIIVSTDLIEHPKRAEGNSLIAKAEIEITGVPKDKEPNNYAFKINIVAAGIFRLPSEVTPIDTRSEPIRTDLCQQLYPMVITEAKAVALKLGFNNVQLPWQLDSIPIAKPKANISKSKKSAPDKIATVDGKPKRPRAVKKET